MKNILLVLLMGYGLIGCSDDNSTAPQTLTSSPPSSISDINTTLSTTESITLKGRVVDGEIDGAQVFLDLNQNGYQDSNEPSTTTDAKGYYQLKVPSDQANDYTAPLVTMGGRDIRLNRDFEEVLMAFRDRNDSRPIIITPLSTLVTQDTLQQLSAQEKSQKSLLKPTVDELFALIAESQAKIATIFTLDIALLTQDPIEVALTGNLDLLQTNMRVNQVVKEMKKAIVSEVQESAKEAIESYKTLTKALNEAQKAANEGDDLLSDALDYIAEVAPDLFNPEVVPVIKAVTTYALEELDKSWESNRDAIMQALQEEQPFVEIQEEMQSIESTIAQADTDGDGLPEETDFASPLPEETTPETTTTTPLTTIPLTTTTPTQTEENDNDENNLSPESCNLDTILDDSEFEDSFITNNLTDIPWEGSAFGVEDIEAIFNAARANDPTINLPLTLPTQATWDAMSNQEKGLYLLNKERYDRGIKPYEGADDNVINTAQTYAQLLYDTGTFGHEEDGTPWERLDRIDAIKNNRDFFPYAENLYATAGSASYTPEPIAQAIYNWIYNDQGSNYGHRKFALASGLNDNHDQVGTEGVIGFGLIEGDQYSYYEGWKSTIVVLNGFDPNQTYQTNNLLTVTLCTDDNISTEENLTTVEEENSTAIENSPIEEQNITTTETLSVEEENITTTETSPIEEENIINTENSLLVEEGSLSTQEVFIVEEENLSTTEANQNISIEVNLTTVEDENISTEENLTTTEDENISTEENLTTVEDENISTEENLTTVEDENISTEENLTTVEDENISTEENLTTVEDENISTEENLTTVEDENISTEENLTVQLMGEAPTSVHLYDIYQFQPTLEDNNESNLSYFILNKPTWATFETTTGLLYGIPLQEGNETNITIGITNGEQNVTLEPFDIEILAPRNLANLYAKATQPPRDDYAYYLEPSLAIDNNQSTYNHTQDAPLNWLQLELPQGTVIHQVIIYNRSDYPSRLEGAKLYLRNNNMEENTSLLNNEVMSLEGIDEAQIWNNEENQTGSWLVIKGADEENKNLHIQEIVVYGTAPDQPIFTTTEQSYLIPYASSTEDIVATIKAIDTQEDELTYQILEADVPFTIDPRSGEIHIEDALVAGSNYNLTIMVSDGINEATLPIEINVTAENAVDQLLISGDVLATPVTEKELIEATLEEIENSKNLLLDAKISIFNLNSDGSEKSDGSSLTSIDWDPTLYSALLGDSFGINTTLLYTNSVTDSDHQLYQRSVAILGEKVAPYMVFAGNPLRNEGNDQMNQFVENTIRYLTGREDLNESGFSVVIAHLNESSSFPDESATRDWLDNHYSNISYNEENTCDGSALQGCLDEHPDLLILSQVSEDENDDLEAIAQTVNQALLNGTPVLYLHFDGILTDLGKTLFSQVFDVSYIWHNYWFHLALEDYNPLEYLFDNSLAPEIASIETLFTHLRDQDYAFDWSRCKSGDTYGVDYEDCEEVEGLESDAIDGMLEAQKIVQFYDENKRTIFDGTSTNYRFQRLLILTGDKIRQSVTYPMMKTTTDDNEFMYSYYSDHVVFNSRTINPAQPDLGNFGRSDFSHITPTTRTVTLTSKDPFRSTGAYALPGQTVKVTRSDENCDLEVKIFVNSLKSSATHEFLGENVYPAYARPKYLQSVHLPIACGESISFTSPYGGPIQAEFTQDDINTSLVFENVGEHPYWDSPEDNDAFQTALDANEYDWAEISTKAFEVHSRIDKMQESIVRWGDDAGISNPTGADLANAILDFTYKYPFALAGFQAEGLEVIDEAVTFANDHEWSIDTINFVKHMNADQASCGYGCSGNPYDAYWSFNPIGHGDIHEIGHDLESRGRYLFEGWELHAITNPYAFYVRSKFFEIFGYTDPNGEYKPLPFKEVFETLNQSINEENATAYLNENLWPGAWDNQFLFNLQCMMNAQQMSKEDIIDDAHKLESGWHLLTRQQMLEREFNRALTNEDLWEEKKESLGFSTYSLEEAKAISNNDWLAIVYSYVSGADFRDYLDLWALPYSTKASDQIASFEFPVVPRHFFVSTPAGYYQEDEYGRLLDKEYIEVDGSTSFPY